MTFKYYKAVVKATWIRQVTRPWRQVTPPWRQVTPPSKQVTPPWGQLTPPSGQLTPPSKQVTPPWRQVTPPWRQVTPPSGQLTPPSKQVTPPSGQLTPLLGQVEPWTTWTTLNPFHEEIRIRKKGREVSSVHWLHVFQELTKVSCIKDQWPLMGSYWIQRSCIVMPGRRNILLQ